MTDFIGHYDPLLGSIPITDARIRAALPFLGHRPAFLDWPSALWHDRAAGKPCRDPERNAYHIRYLAERMRERGWVGAPLLAYQGTPIVRDGNHRYRAVQFLRDQEGIQVEVPVRYYRKAE